MPDAIAQFANAKYLSLESFRKSGVGVRTPVWFAADAELPSSVSLAQEGTIEENANPAGKRSARGIVFYVCSAPDAGKVKRIRNNSKVRIAPCTLRGELRGAWIEARARICGEEESAHGQQLLRRKYGWMKIIGDFFARLRRRTQSVIAITVD